MPAHNHLVGSRLTELDVLEQEWAGFFANDSGLNVDLE
jgi:hypothetical protein